MNNNGKQATPRLTPHLGHWIHSYVGQVPTKKGTDFSKEHVGKYLSGYASRTVYKTLQEAQEACIADSSAAGVTKEGGHAYTVRTDSTTRESFTNESSWLKTKKYPGCAMKFTGGDGNKLWPQQGVCVHGVGGNNLHYTCCGLQDRDSECPVLRLPLGVVLMKNFLSGGISSSEAARYQVMVVRSMLQRTREEGAVMHVDRGILGYSTQAIKTALACAAQGQRTHACLNDHQHQGGAVDVFSVANKWQQVLSHGSTRSEEFKWANGHFYCNGSTQSSVQGPHRDTGADIDRTLGISIGSTMTFRWSVKSPEHCRTPEDFEHSIEVKNGDALLFDGISLTHSADSLQPDTRPGWWDAVIDEFPEWKDYNPRRAFIGLR
jgi:hypothetical protein